MRNNQRTSLLIELINWYCNHTPIKIGRAKLRRFGLRTLKGKEVITESLDEIKFALQLPSDSSWFSIYYEGTFETGTLALLKKLLHADDIVIDIGANIGWYTTHVAKIITRGHCHAFEPVPAIFNKLKRNCELNNLFANVSLNNCALGEKTGTVELHTFPDLPHGHSSISTLGKSNYETSIAQMITLDSYVESQGLSQVDIIKMDVEGAEALVLAGAKSILSHAIPPIWIIELNVETSANFKHRPSDLLKTLGNYAEYDFYRVITGWGECVRMDSIEDYENGDNAVCVPKTRADRMNSYYS